MPLSPGTRLGPYEVLSAIGSGGMGEVYRARDTKLNRDVALKVLPGSVAGDLERLARFRREAQVLAALNHPNIAHIHGLEDTSSAPALVMELVEGPTLADLLLAKGPGQRAQDKTGSLGLGPGALGLASAFAIARQIATALEAAHAQSIIHRDLKPANVKVRDDGTVKVLDFGLAKVLASAASGHDVETLTALDTQAGLVMGTPAYMSPEQARGAAVDARTDIWAFGCVLYELLSGRRTFVGDSAVQILNAVIEREPDWSAIAHAPPAIQKLVRRCLQKDPRRRLRDIGDARLEIDEAEAGDETTPATSDPRRARRSWFLMTAGLTTGLIVAAAAWFGYRALFLPSSTARQDVLFERITDAVGVEESPAISPDGKTVAYVGYAGGRQHIWIRLLAGGKPLKITEADLDHEQPRWTPDSNRILYFTRSQTEDPQGTLWEVPALGGQPHSIARALGGGDISHDGQRIAAFQLVDNTARLMILGRDGTVIRELLQVPGGGNGRTPRWAPDDQSVAYIESGSRSFSYKLAVVSVTSSERTEVAVETFIVGGLTWTPDGSGLVYGSPKGSTILYPSTFQLRLAPLGGGQSEQLTFGTESYTHPDIHATSGLLLATRTQLHSALWKVPTTDTPTANARAAVPLTSQTSQVQTPSAGPNGKLVFLSDSGGHGNLWVTDTERRDPVQITHERNPAVSIGVPVWSPDGSQIAHIRTTAGNSEQWLVKADGSEARKLLDRGVFASWSRDSAWLYYAIRDPDFCIERLQVADPSARPERIRCDGATAPMPGRDGSLIFQRQLVAPIGGFNYEIHRANSDRADSTLLLPIDGRRLSYDSAFGVPTALSPDGKWLAYAVMDGATANLWKLSTDGGKPQRITDFGDRASWIVRQITWAGPDGRFIYAAIANVDADIVSIAGVVRAKAK